MFHPGRSPDRRLSAASRIVPSDDTGPGAKEAGVVIYIDRQLAGPWGRDRFRYTHAPFDEEAAPEFGYQGKATPREIYRSALKDLAGFDALPAEQQDARLKSIESGVFFTLLRRNTIEGMFCDPMHGGNVDMVGWQMIGFPGPRMSNYGEMRIAATASPSGPSRSAWQGRRRASHPPARGRDHMKTLPHVDVVMIGGGWSGLLMAKELGARTSLNVVVLERGGPRKTEDYAGAMDELDHNVRFRMMQDYSLETTTLRYTTRDKAIPIRQLGSFMPGTGTGGAGEHWTGVFPRHVPDMFELLKSTNARYGAARLPEDHAFTDWGMDWKEIEPYYARADKLSSASPARPPAT